MALAAAGLLAATTLGGAYINARFGIGTDLRNLLDDRAMQKRVVERLSSLGGSPTLYSIFAQGDPAADALWFEGRTWSYRELKEGLWFGSTVSLGLLAHFSNRCRQIRQSPPNRCTHRTRRLCGSVHHQFSGDGGGMFGTVEAWGGRCHAQYQPSRYVLGHHQVSSKA